MHGASPNTSPTYGPGAALVGIAFGAAVTGIMRDNSVIGFTNAHTPFGGGGGGPAPVMTDGGGNVP